MRRVLAAHRDLLQMLGALSQEAGRPGALLFAGDSARDGTSYSQCGRLARTHANVIAYVVSITSITALVPSQPAGYVEPASKLWLSY
jgi:hypothetical protein